MDKLSKSEESTGLDGELSEGNTGKVICRVDELRATQENIKIVILFRQTLIRLGLYEEMSEIQRLIQRVHLQHSKALKELGDD